MQKLYGHAALLTGCIGLFTLARNLADYKNTALGWTVAILAAVGGIVFIVLVVLDIAKNDKGNAPRTPTGPSELTLPPPIFQLTFDYLPKSPLAEGWRRGYGKEEPTCSKWSATPRGMTMSQNQCFAMDYTLPEFARLCNHVEFTAQFVSDVIIYLDVEIISRDRSSTNSFWLRT